MPGAITDRIARVTDSTTGRPIITTLSATKSIGAASITVSAATNWTTTTVIHFSIYEVTAGGVKNPTTQTDWKATLSGTTLSSMTLTGGTDRAYNAGAIVEITPTARWAKDLYDWAIVQHNQDGTHGAVTATSVSTPSLTSTGTVTLPNNSITAANLATSAITLGYAQITANFATTATAVAQVTGLSAAVTIPAGGRRVRITFYAQSLFNNASAQDCTVSIWDGAVGTGTQLSRNVSTSSAAFYQMNAYCSAIVTPAAGAKTYNIGFHVAGNTGTISAAATAPAYIHVEVV